MQSLRSLEGGGVVPHKVKVSSPCFSAFCLWMLAQLDVQAPRGRVWSQETDTLIIRLVEKYGPKHWSQIAAHVNPSETTESASINRCFWLVGSWPIWKTVSRAVSAHCPFTTVCLVQLQCSLVLALSTVLSRHLCSPARSAHLISV